MEIENKTMKIKNTVIFKYYGNDKKEETVNIDYNKISHCKLVIDTIDIFGFIKYIQFYNYLYESVMKYIRFVNTYSIGNYTIYDVELGNYIGDEVYVKDVLNQLTKYNISADLCEFMINTNHVKQFEFDILKCLNKYVLSTCEFISFIDTTEIYMNKLNNKYSSEDSTKFDYLINLISGSDIIILLKNYILFDHVIGTYIYIYLCKQGLKICSSNMMEMIDYKDTENIFCREVLELYKDKNTNINILLSQIFNLSNKRFIYYTKSINMGVKYTKSISKLHRKPRGDVEPISTTHTHKCKTCDFLGLYDV